MTVSALPVDQRVIDIDSRRFASVEKALVELITNCDDSYSRLEHKNICLDGTISISYERHQNGGVLSVSDQAEGMNFNRLISVLSYGGAHSLLAAGESGGRGYFGRGMKQAIYGLGYGWIETICEDRYSRVDLYRDKSGGYFFDDGDGDRIASYKDYQNIPEKRNGTKVTIIIDNPQTNIPYFSSLSSAISNNIYLRDILKRRKVEVINLNQSKKVRTVLKLAFEEPESQILIGPGEHGRFIYEGKYYTFYLTLKKALNQELVIKGDERTNGLLVISGTAVLDCQFFKFENQLGTEFLFGTVICDGLSEMLSKGYPVISDEREGLNLKDPFVAAFSEEISKRLLNIIKSEQLRLSHYDHAKISDRTKSMIDNVLKKMNDIAVHELGIVLPPGPGSGKYGPYDTGRPAVLRFSTPFYYRKYDHPFHVSLIVDKSQLIDQDIINFVYELPEDMMAEPFSDAVSVSELPEDGRFIWTVTGMQIGSKGRIGATIGPYEAFCEVVIAEDASGMGYGHPSKKPSLPWIMDNSTDMFRGYELRNLDNDMDRAVYSKEERLILINTEAPTVRLYVNGQGHFKDGARLLLAELLLDVITEEMAKYYIDRTTKKGNIESYRQAKQDLIRRYGVVIHSILLGE